MSDYLVCSHCGAKVLADKLLTTTSDDLLCIDCIEEGDYVQCNDCELYTDDYITTSDGDYICTDCEDNYFYCDECHEWHNEDDSVYVENEDIKICSHCFDNYFSYCNDCSKAIRDKNLTEGYCNDCYSDHYTECEECGETISIDDRYYDEDGERDLCYECYQNTRNKVKDYGYTPDLNFLKIPIEKTTLYYGLELEVSGEERYSGEFLDYFKEDEKEVFLTHDSSIRDGGFEITTQPMTYAYILNELQPKLTKALKFLASNDFNSHNYGGLHIHTSREAWTRTQLAQLCEIMYGDENDRNTWLLITQRKEEKMEEWASMSSDDYDFDDVMSGDSPACERYTAVNFRSDTIEFRIFNGNLRIERILKNLECVKAMYDYTYTLKRKHTPQATTTKFLEYVMNRAELYPNLVSFIAERDIQQKHLQGITEDDLELIAA